MQSDNTKKGHRGKRIITKGFDSNDYEWVFKSSNSLINYLL